MIMSDEKEKHDECRIAQTDAEGNTNLCCCYIIDWDGRYEDPCYLPAEAVADPEDVRSGDEDR